MQHQRSTGQVQQSNQKRIQDNVTWEAFEDANRLLWMDKRRLVPADWCDQEIESMADRCFRRLWGNHEAVYKMDGFEEAFNNKFQKYIKN
jgi:hypothetical protein